MRDCTIIRGSGGAYRGKQGLDYFAGVSAESSGSEGLHLLVVPSGGEPTPHLQEGHESAIHMLEGPASMRHGPDLERVETIREGDLVHIPAGVPHEPFNPTDKVARALIPRTDPNEQESVVLP